jgi:hypothetical protein
VNSPVLATVVTKVPGKATTLPPDKTKVYKAMKNNWHLQRAKKHSMMSKTSKFKQKAGEIT